MRCTIPSLIESQPAAPRAFRAFRESKRAATFCVRRGESATLRRVAYGTDPRDVRYVVNYVGSPARDRVKLAPARVIMSAGITFDRLLPVRTSRVS